MKIIINNSSMVPIYVQIIQQIKAQIAECTLKENEALPSVRSLSRDLNISALTVKKAYDELESDGFVITVHGKGTYVNGNNSEYIKESRLKEVEEEIRTAFEKAENYGISKEQLREIFEMFFEE
ncbi:MAG: GntR family transcriptional regulator [Lachnospiraceae bacterium]|nr:GntR family transcriptional regulator [Lachnospiraceae bacterium]